MAGLASDLCIGPILELRCGRGGGGLTAGVGGVRRRDLPHYSRSGRCRSCLSRGREALGGREGGGAEAGEEGEGGGGGGVVEG